ncbi:MAG: zinc-dependent alcohol dehydrogenase [Gemmatimonadota bacterium]
MRAIRLHYRPVRYILARGVSRRAPTWSLGPLGFIRLDDVEPPALPGPDWVRVETTLSGICGSDLAAITAHDSFTLEPFGEYPFTFGHENVGRIVEQGDAAGGGGGDDDWSIGDRVVVNPMLSCAQRGFDPPCDACARGEYGLCRRTTDSPMAGPMVGYCPDTGGGWSPSFVAHRSRLHRPGELPDEVAVLADPFASALRPVLLHPPRGAGRSAEADERAAPEARPILAAAPARGERGADRDGDVVLVIGAGTIGLLTVRALRLTGWTGPVAVQARYAHQRRLAEQAGADRVLMSRDAVFEWAASLPGARSHKPSLAPRFVDGGPSLVYDTVGSQGTVRQSLALAREGGRVVLVGGAARVDADWTRVWYRQLTVAGVFAYGLVPFEGERRDIYDVTLELMRRDDDFAGLGMLTHVYRLEDYRAAISAALDKDGHGSVKVAFRPGD